MRISFSTLNIPVLRIQKVILWTRIKKWNIPLTVLGSGRIWDRRRTESGGKKTFQSALHVISFSWKYRIIQKQKYWMKIIIIPGWKWKLRGKEVGLLWMLWKKLLFYRLSVGFIKKTWWNGFSKKNTSNNWNLSRWWIFGVVWKT